MCLISHLTLRAMLHGYCTVYSGGLYTGFGTLITEKYLHLVYVMREYTLNDRVRR